VEVDLDAIRANTLAFVEWLAMHRKRSKPATAAALPVPLARRAACPCQLMAVVKADAYGHGAVPVARAALEAGATWLGVATVDEALELRASGLTAPILLLAEAPETALGDLVEAHVTCTAASLDFLHTLSGYGLLNNVELPYHLKIDTGMNRIGVAPADALSVLKEATELPKLKLQGVFTHFATADVAGDWDARKQLERFQDVLRQIEEAGIEVELRHACNSAATLLMPEAHLDMVRVGISLYGLHTSDDMRKPLALTPTMSVRARATCVKHLSMGEGVGYNLSWRAFKPTTLVTLPLGYADGVPRAASNKLDVLISATGRRIEQAGLVCMDQLMAAASGAEPLAPGDEFTLIGTAGRVSDAREAARKLRTHNTSRTDGFISVEEVADKSDTIVHEIVCGFGQRLERVYRNK
jgi:alanine racemase